MHLLKRGTRVPNYVAIVEETPQAAQLTFRYVAPRRLPQGRKFVADDGRAYQVIREVAPPDVLPNEPGTLLVRLISPD